VKSTVRSFGFGLAVLLGAVGVAPLPGQVQLQAANLFVYGGGYSAVHKAFNLTTGTTDDFKTGFDLGGGVGLEIHKYLEVRATLTGAQSHLRVNGAESAVYLNRYYVGADVKGRYPLPSGVTPYGLAGGGVVVLHEKGTTGGDKAQGFGHLGLGVAYPMWSHSSVFVQGDGFFYSLSGLSGGALSAYSSAQFDIAWSAGVSYRFAL
jgi:outer membrane protein with beta-barrel domain